MKKLLIVSLILLFVVPSVMSRRKPDRAGSVSDYVFTDKKFDFSIKLNDGWKYKIQKNEDICRLTMVQVDYAIPPDYQAAPDYTKIPRVVFSVAETNLDPRTFVDSLVSETFDSDQKSELLKEFEILNIGPGSGFSPEKLVPRGANNFEVKDLKAHKWTGQLKYTNEVSTSASSLGGKRVKGAYGGMIVAIEKGDKILLIHAICEWIYFSDIEKSVMEFVNSLEWK